MCDDSNTVPILTVKGLSQARQFQRPGRVVLPFEREASPTVPQCGQTGPSGHSRASTYSIAASSLHRCGGLRSDFMAAFFPDRHSTSCVFYVKCNTAMSIIAWIIVGLIAGFIGSKIVNREGSGIILDIVIGVVGAFVGGW